MVCILTDGEENKSNNEKYKIASNIKYMIEHQRTKYGWEFSYLGANQDAFKVASDFGISKGFTVNFSADSDGTRSAYDSMNMMTKSYRASN